MRSGSPAPRAGRLAWLGARLYGNRRRAAFTLLTLAVGITLLNIAVAAALPAWGHMIQYDKEEELIFRGLQYAEAIRIFQIRFGRFPTNLKELKETEPRCLRQLWKNPLTEDGRWGLVPAGVGAPVPGQPGGAPVPNNGLGDPDEGLDSPNAGQSQPGKGGAPGQGTPQVIWSEDMDEDSKIDLGKPRNNLPIRGVYSPSSLEAIHIFGGKESITEWQFTVELVSAMQQGTPDNPGFVRPFPVDQIGKPWPPGVTPPLPQPTSNPIGPGGANQPGGKPGSPPFRGDDGSGRDIRQIPQDQLPGPQPEPDGGG